jgi:WD40 repeat protein
MMNTTTTCLLALVVSLGVNHVPTMADPGGPLRTSFDPDSNADPPSEDSPRELTPKHVMTVGERVFALAISPDGKTIAAGGGGGTGLFSEGPADVHLWSMDGRRIGRLKGHPGRIRDIAFAADGKTFVSVSAGGFGTPSVAILWDAKRRTLKAKRPYRKGGVSAVAFSPDVRTMVLAGTTVELWDTRTGKVTGTLKGQMRSVSGISISTNGVLLACGASDYKAYVWNLKQKRLVKTFSGFEDTPSAVAFSPDGASLAVSGFYERGTRIYDTKEWNQTLLPFTARGLAYSPDGQFLVFLEFGTDGVCSWDLKRSKAVARLTGHDGIARELDFSSDGKMLVTGDNTTIRIWDVSEFGELRGP